MKNKKLNKEYQFETLNQICNVINDDNFESLMKDLVLWFDYYLTIVEEFKKQYPDKCTPDMSNTEILECKFGWIDDGKNEMKKIQFINKFNGEIINIKPKK